MRPTARVVAALAVLCVAAPTLLWCPVAGDGSTAEAPAAGGGQADGTHAPPFVNQVHVQLLEAVVRTDTWVQRGDGRGGDGRDKTGGTGHTPQAPPFVVLLRHVLVNGTAAAAAATASSAGQSRPSPWTPPKLGHRHVARAWALLADVLVVSVATTLPVTAVTAQRVLAATVQGDATTPAGAAAADAAAAASPEQQQAAVGAACSEVAAAVVAAIRRFDTDALGGVERAARRWERGRVFVVADGADAATCAPLLVLRAGGGDGQQQQPPPPPAQQQQQHHHHHISGAGGDLAAVLASGPPRGLMLVNSAVTPSALFIAPGRAALETGNLETAYKLQRAREATCNFGGGGGGGSGGGGDGNLPHRSENNNNTTRRGRRHHGPQSPWLSRVDLLLRDAALTYRRAGRRTGGTGGGAGEVPPSDGAYELSHLASFTGRVAAARAVAALPKLLPPPLHHAGAVAPADASDGYTACLGPPPPDSGGALSQPRSEGAGAEAEAEVAVTAGVVRDGSKGSAGNGNISPAASGAPTRRSVVRKPFSASRAFALGFSRATPVFPDHVGENKEEEEEEEEEEEGSREQTGRPDGGNGGGGGGSVGGGGVQRGARSPRPAASGDGDDDKDAAATKFLRRALGRLMVQGVPTVLWHARPLQGGAGGEAGSDALTCNFYVAMLRAAAMRWEPPAPLTQSADGGGQQKQQQEQEQTDALRRAARRFNRAALEDFPVERARTRRRRMFRYSAIARCVGRRLWRADAASNGARDGDGGGGNDDDYGTEPRGTECSVGWPVSGRGFVQRSRALTWLLLEAVTGCPLAAAPCGGGGAARPLTAPSALRVLGVLVREHHDQYHGGDGGGGGDSGGDSGGGGGGDDAAGSGDSGRDAASNDSGGGWAAAAYAVDTDLDHLAVVDLGLL